LIVLFAAAQIVLWTLAPALTYRAPPIDVVEGYMWGREWVIATYKHPALPSWFLEGSRLLTGTTGWPAYLTSQLFIAATFGLVFVLGCDMMGRERAAAGTLLLAGVTYYMWPTPEFNHNVASTPLWAGIVLTLWRAVERGRMVWWVLMGLFAAGALYAKLSAVFLLVPAAAWILWDGRARAIRDPADTSRRLVGATQFDTAAVRSTTLAGATGLSTAAVFTRYGRQPRRHCGDARIRQGVRALERGQIAAG
jgi:4-amino-4-deoxy-L-arabinose transferase-like glycosyltransferase